MCAKQTNKNPELFGIILKISNMYFFLFTKTDTFLMKSDGETYLKAPG